MGQLLLAGMDGAYPCSAQEVHHHRAQEGEQRRSDPVGLAVSVLTQLHVTYPVPLVLNAPALTHQS